MILSNAAAGGGGSGAAVVDLAQKLSGPSPGKRDTGSFLDLAVSKFLDRLDAFNSLLLSLAATEDPSTSNAGNGSW